MTAEQDTKVSTRDTVDLTRLLGFSDAFFPIIITLLVIEIHVPEAPPGALGHALLEAWPSYAAFALAFIYVGIIWLNHHGLFRRVSRTDTRLNWINLGILGTSALIPFPTRVLAEALQAGNVADQTSAVVLYGMLAALMSFAWAPIFPYLERHRERLAPDVPAGYFAAQRSRPWVGVICYLTAIATSLLFSPWAGMSLLLVILFYHAMTSEGLRNVRADLRMKVGDASPA
nr:TMEM175 family protein [Sphingomonas arenae]